LAKQSGQLARSEQDLAGALVEQTNNKKRQAAENGRGRVGFTRENSVGLWK